MPTAISPSTTSSPPARSAPSKRQGCGFPTTCPSSGTTTRSSPSSTTCRSRRSTSRDTRWVNWRSGRSWSASRTTAPSPPVSTSHRPCRCGGRRRRPERPDMTGRIRIGIVGTSWWADSMYLLRCGASMVSTCPPSSAATPTAPRCSPKSGRSPPPSPTPPRSSSNHSTPSSSHRRTTRITRCRSRRSNGDSTCCARNHSGSMSPKHRR